MLRGGARSILAVVDLATITGALKAIGDATWRIWTGIFVASLLLLVLPAAWLPVAIGQWPVLGLVVSGSFLMPFVGEVVAKRRRELQAKADEQAARLAEAAAAEAEIDDALHRCPDAEKRVLLEAHANGGTLIINWRHEAIRDADALCHKGLLLKVDITDLQWGSGFMYKIPDEVLPILDRIVAHAKKRAAELEAAAKQDALPPADD